MGMEGEEEGVWREGEGWQGGKGEGPSVFK